jgi:hypothetical protein
MNDKAKHLRDLLILLCQAHMNVLYQAGPSAFGSPQESNIVLALTTGTDTMTPNEIFAVPSMTGYQIATALVNWAILKTIPRPAWIPNGVADPQ